MNININRVKIVVWSNKIVVAVVKNVNYFLPPFWIFFKNRWPSSPAACILLPGGGGGGGGGGGEG